jgi:CBS-domain-containing membrane protein
MKIKDVMTPEVISIRADRPFREAVELMLAARVSGLPVLDADERLVGIVTEADCVAKEAASPERRRRTLRAVIDPVFAQSAERAVASTGTKVADVMTCDVAVAKPDEAVRSVARRMLELGVKRMPVESEDGELVGVVSRHDLIKVFRRSDDTLASDVRATLARSLYVSPEHDVWVTARNGVVTVTGRVLRESDVAIVPEIVRTVDGVVDLVVDLEFLERDPKERHMQVVAP